MLEIKALFHDSIFIAFRADRFYLTRSREEREELKWIKHYNKSTFSAPLAIFFSLSLLRTLRGFA